MKSLLWHFQNQHFESFPGELMGKVRHKSQNSHDEHYYDRAGCSAERWKSRDQSFLCLFFVEELHRRL